jgi:hypothetical protein
MQNITHHASSRMQKRSVPPIVIDRLRDYGSEQYDGHGAVIRYFDRAARARLARVCGRHFVQANRKYLNMYMVEDSTGQSVITVGYRIRRIRRR